MQVTCSWENMDIRPLSENEKILKKKYARELLNEENKPQQTKPNQNKKKKNKPK